MDQKDHFIALDGMRGIAAIAVMVFHYMSDFSMLGWSRPDSLATPFKCAPLAVDFFFMLSGFVLSAAYTPGLLRDAKWGGFFRKRLLRLYPMYAIGMAFGMIALILSLHLRPVDAGPVSGWGDVAASLALSLAMVPDYIGHYGLILGSTSLEGAAFPLNPPGWTLFYELIASLMLVALVRKSDRVLVGMVAGSLFVMLAATPFTAIVFHQRGHTFFFSGGARPDLWLGLSRVVTGFVTGVLLWRLRSANKLQFAPFTWRIRPVTAYTMLMASFALPSTLKGAWPLAFLTFVGPVFLVWGANIRFRPGLGRDISAALGWISFPLYCVHYPVGQIAWLICNRLGLSVWIAFASAIVLSLALGAITARFIEEPVRRRLAGRLYHREPAVTVH
ncbi:acyltransferase family protein [Novosphingobium sediminicola]|uniref:Peptidoglycan/LPS O-acetylase OafA/YrhL n=1 Tax=Novosphingobium sediminicola TaxID=563162 RepID=A0A7W6G7N1_9SPHN|nr:acyltransferase [Novosphingobium sediminicola]MBB3957084.1 peptidoglycan/LPS O-acetylase OafA/YrhL [Novosphingobium sediminicola]